MAVFITPFSKYPLKFIATFFQYSHRCQIWTENRCNDSNNLSLRENNLSQFVKGSSGIARAPKWLSDPVANFRSSGFLETASFSSNAPDEIFVNGYGPNNTLLAAN